MNIAQEMQNFANMIDGIIAGLNAQAEMHVKGEKPKTQVIDLTGATYRNGMLIEEDKLTGNNDNV